MHNQLTNIGNNPKFQHHQ